MNHIVYRDRNKGKCYIDGRPKKPNWAYRFEVASVRGKRHFFEKCGFASKNEAVMAGVKAFQEYNSCGSIFEETSMSYSDCLDSWMENYVSLRCIPTTRAQYEGNLARYIRPALGMYRLSSIRRETVQNFINSMFRDRFSRNTLVNILGMLTNSFRYAKKQGWILVNPAEDIDLPTTRQCANNRKKIREPVPRQIIDKMFDRFPEGHPDRIGIMLAYHCGLRLGEAYGLEWEDVDLQYGIITVQHQTQWSQTLHGYIIVPPKYDSCRQIRLDNVMWEFLKREKERQDEGRIKAGKHYFQLYIDENSLLNTEQRGRPVYMVNTRPDGTYIQEHVSRHVTRIVKQELGYANFDFHSLRHTHATELSEAGVNIKEIQRRLGHSTMEITTKRYLHATSIMEEQSVELMNRMFGGEDKQPADTELRILRFAK